MIYVNDIDSVTEQDSSVMGCALLFIVQCVLATWCNRTSCVLRSTPNVETSSQCLPYIAQLHIKSIHEIYNDMLSKLVDNLP